MIPIIFFLCISIGTSQAQEGNDTIIIPEQPELVINGTTLSDRVLFQVKRHIYNLGLNDIRLMDVGIIIHTSSVRLYNGHIRNLGNIDRVGDVIVTVRPTDTKFRCAYGVTNVSADQDVTIFSLPFNASNGHAHLYSENVTIYTVYKLDHGTQTLTLDEFELSVGYVNVSITGLGARLANSTYTTTTIVNNVKGPFLRLFNFTFKIVFNLALAAIRSILLG